MNKKVIDEEIAYAYKSLQDSGIAKKNPDTGKTEIKKAYQAQIASFGAAVATGSLLAAVCFFLNDGNSAVKRSKLMEAIELILKEHGEVKEISGGAHENEKKCKDLLEYIDMTAPKRAKEEIVNAAIALKLAMNLYTLTEE